MAVILDVGTIPQTFSAGNWPKTHLNTGLWQFVWTPTNANTHASWGGDYYALIAADDLGGLWIVADALHFYDQSQALRLELPLTWSAGAAITITIDMAAGEVSIAGASTGNGTFPWDSAPTSDFWAGDTLGVGVYGGGGFNLPASTISDFDDLDAGGVDGDLAATLAAVTSSSTGAVAIAAALAATLAAVTSSSAGAVLAAGAATPTLGAVTPAAAGAVAIEAVSSATLGDVLLAATAGADGAEGELAATLGAIGSASTGTVGVAGSSGPTLGAVASVAAGAVSLAAAAAPTLGAVTSSAAGAVAIAAAATPALGAITCSATVNDAFGLGAYDAERVLYGTAAGTVNVTLQTSDGSTFVAVSAGNLDDLAADPLTDDEANAWGYLSTDEYNDWPGYGAVLAVTTTGNGDPTGHVFSQQFGQTLGFDECTVAAVEVQSAAYVADWSATQVNNGSPLTAAPVTTTARATLIAFWLGDAPTGATSTVGVNNGFTVIHTETLADHPDGYVPIAIAFREVDEPGTYDVTWTETPDQGAILYLVAVQAVEGRVGEAGALLGALALAAEADVTSGGELASTLGAVTSSSGGAVAIAAAGASTLGAVTSSAAATVSVSAAAEPTLGAVTSSAGAAALITAASTPMLGALTLAAEGETTDVALTLDVTLAPVTGAATGAVAITAASSPTLAAITSSAAAGVRIAGEASPTLPAITLASLGDTADVHGDAAATLGAITCVAAGTVAAPVYASPRNATAALATPTTAVALATPTVTARWE